MQLLSRRKTPVRQTPVSGRRPLARPAGIDAFDGPAIENDVSEGRASGRLSLASMDEVELSTGRQKPKWSMLCTCMGLNQC